MYSIPCFRTVPVRLSVARASTVLHLPDAIFSMSRQNRKKESNSGYMKSKWTLHIKKKPSLDTLVTFNSSFRSAKSVAGTSFLVAFFAWFSYKSGRTYDVMQKLKITCRTSGGTTVIPGTERNNRGIFRERLIAGTAPLIITRLRPTVVNTNLYYVSKAETYQVNIILF